MHSQAHKALHVEGEMLRGTLMTLIAKGEVADMREHGLMIKKTKKWIEKAKDLVKRTKTLSKRSGDGN